MEIFTRVNDSFIVTYPWESIQVVGAGTAAYETKKDLLKRVRRYWIHLDVDVLSVEAMPAVDYRQPGGMNWEELKEVLEELVNRKNFIGMDVTIYNPKLDDDKRSAGKKLTDLLVDVLNG